MDKRYLKENNLMDAHKEFMRLCEYVSAAPLVEDDDDDDNNQPQDGSDDMNNGPDMGGAPNGGPGDDMNGDSGMGAPNDMGGAPDNNAMGGDPNGGPMGGPNGDAPDMGSDPMGGPNGGAPDMGGTPMGGDPMGGPDMMGGMPDMEDEDEEVIDVEDITNAQEKMNDKVNSVGRNLNQVDDRISKLFDTIDKMERMIDANNAEIAAFKKEFEKRNPTPTEKLNLRSLDSYPFNVNPKDYWAEKGIANPGTSSVYKAYSDNEEPTTQEYEITNKDVDDFDERKIGNSFFIDDDLRQTLGKIFDI